jgi:hypothetical protein
MKKRIAIFFFIVGSIITSIVMFYSRVMDSIRAESKEVVIRQEKFNDEVFNSWEKYTGNPKGLTRREFDTLKQSKLIFSPTNIETTVENP